MGDFKWEHAPGEWTTIKYIDSKITPCHKFPKIKKSTNMHESITNKIKTGSVTIDDFNKFINESLGSSIISRVRERTRVDVGSSHVDNKTGQQSLDPVPKSATPKRKPSNRSKLNGRGRQARRRSARTEKQKAKNKDAAESINKYNEATQFINDNINKSIKECVDDLNNVNDKESLRVLLTRMLCDNSWGGSSANTDWVYDICNLIKV